MRDAQKRGQAAAARGERIAMLRRLGVLCDTRLSDLEGVVWASRSILELLPGDREALERLERVLAEADDLTRLEQTLEYHVEAASGPAEKAKVLKRLAQLVTGREVAGDAPSPHALERWERVREVAPNDPEALAVLADLYEAQRAWKQLADVLERALRGGRPHAAPRAPRRPPERAARQARRGRAEGRTTDGPLAAGHARRPHRAPQAPGPRARHRARRCAARAQGLEAGAQAGARDREALDALMRLCEARQQWRNLVDVLARRIAIESDKSVATELSLTRTDILEERLGAPDEAVRAGPQCSAVNPTHLGMHARLRHLYEMRGDVAEAVRIAERELYLARSPAVKVARGLGDRDAVA